MTIQFVQSYYPNYGAKVESLKAVVACVVTLKGRERESFLNEAWKTVVAINNLTANFYATIGHQELCQEVRDLILKEQESYQPKRAQFADLATRVVELDKELLNAGLENMSRIGSVSVSPLEQMIRDLVGPHPRKWL